MTMMCNRLMNTVLAVLGGLLVLAAMLCVLGIAVFCVRIILPALLLGLLVVVAEKKKIQ